MHICKDMLIQEMLRVVHNLVLLCNQLVFFSAAYDSFREMNIVVETPAGQMRM